jgi:lysozyme
MFTNLGFFAMRNDTKIQPELQVGSGKGKMTAAALGLSLAVGIIANWEGMSAKPYADKLANNLMTVCYGETRVEMRAYTPTECKALLAKGVEDFAEPVMRCVPALRERPYQLAAATSLAYNVGSGAFCRSTAAKRFNRGDWKSGCDAFLMYRFAGGREIRGLLNRRKAERTLCMEGL